MNKFKKKLQYNAIFSTNDFTSLTLVGDGKTFKVATFSNVLKVQ